MCRRLCVAGGKMGSFFGETKITALQAKK